MKSIKIQFKPSGRPEATGPALTQSVHAVTSSERMVGLLKHHGLEETQGMLISACKQVHTLFMKFAIDAIFIDKRGVVVGIQELKPWRLSKMHWRADAVIETPYGWAKRHGVTIGSQTEITPC